MADGSGGDVAAGKAVGAGTYVTWSQAVGTVICARVAAGESIAAVCREAGMPNRVTVRQWALAMPDFQAELAQAMRTARTRERLADRRAARARALVGRDNRGVWSTYTREKGEEICRRIAGGETLASIGRDPAMPCAATVLNWVAQHPEFEDAYVRARQMLADVLFDEAREVALGSTHETVWSDRLAFDVIRWQTARLAPRKYCERIVVAHELEGMKPPAEEPLTVVIRRFTDAPDPEAGEYPEVD